MYDSTPSIASTSTHRRYRPCHGPARAGIRVGLDRAAPHPHHEPPCSCGSRRRLARAGRGTGSGISLARIRALFRPQSRGSCHRRGCGSLCRRHRRRRVDHRWHRRRAVNNRGDRGWRIDHGGRRRRLPLSRWSMIRGASSAKPGPENERHGIRDKLPQEIPAPRHGPIGLTGPSVRECWWDGRWRGGVHWCLKSREGIMAASRDK